MLKKVAIAAIASMMAAAAGLGASAPRAAADVDVYSTPGYHTVNGRQWHTVCEPYSQTTRCRTNIKATQVVLSGGRFVQKTGWVFNNLTYLPSKRSLWSRNPLGQPGRWQAADGRRWRTECDSLTTGRGGCRSYAQATVYARGTNGFVQKTAWVFNNMVRFTTPGTAPTNPTPQPSPKPTPKPTTGAGIDTQAKFAADLVKAANAERVKAGREAVPHQAAMDAEALACAKSNLANDGLSHQLPSCSGQAIYNSQWGENLSTARIGSSAASTVAGWMGSEGHRLAILNPYRNGFGGAYACDADGCVVVLKYGTNWDW